MQPAGGKTRTFCQESAIPHNRRVVGNITKFRENFVDLLHNYYEILKKASTSRGRVI